MSGDRDKRDDAPGDEPGAATQSSLQHQLDWSHRRTRQLLDEVRRGEAENRVLRADVQELEREQNRLRHVLAQAEHLVRTMDEGIRRLQHSASLQLGYILIQAMRSLRGAVSMPLRLFRLFRAQVLGQPGERAATGAVRVPLPHDWVPDALRQDLDAFRSDYRQSDSAIVDDTRSLGSTTLAMRFAALPASLSGVRMAAVMDEFTFAAYSECCEVTQLTPDNWRREIASLAPHVLFVESAWDGKESSWLRKISGASKELRELTDYCRGNGIPVMFWSKEDPVHFKTFLSAARMADVVFTTDIDCIKHYKTELGHGNVFLLPFATQPLRHNPLERYDRKPGFCFAGSYYVRYPTRQRDFHSLIEAVSEIGPVDIYDRNHGKDHPNYVFPEEYHRYILGGLSFDQIDLAYKGYDFGININTVKHSQSMFARRVFDLLASNTTVVSNYSRGLRLMFGDLVTSSDDRDQLIRKLHPMTEDPSLRRRHRLAGLRKAMREHTYQHRLAYAMGKLYRDAPAVTEPEVVVLARARSEAEMQRLLESFARQSWPRKRLVLCFKGDFRPACAPVARDVSVLSTKQATSRPVASLAPDGYVAGFHAGDYYAPNYLADLALAVNYSPAPVIGKGAYFRMPPQGAPILVSDGEQYRVGGAIARRRGMALAGCSDDTIGDWLDGIDTAAWSGDTLMVDEFNYCADADGASSCAAVDDLAGVDEGMPIERLLAIAESIHPDPTGGSGPARDESAGLHGLGAADLFERLGIPGNKYLSTSIGAHGLVLKSTLPARAHAYAYLSGDFSPKELQISDIARMQLVSDAGEALGLVLVYHDADGRKISHSLLKSGANISVSVPSGTDRVRVGLRASRAGEFVIRRLVFDHVPLAVDTFVTRGRHLMVVKNYPSYGDLYKHAFVHRRVAEYQRRGIAVDVFRIGANGLGYYEFDGVDVTYGEADHLRAILDSGSYESVLVHILDERTWEVLQEFTDRLRMYIWVHGSEIQPAKRRECDHVDEAARARAVALGDRRMGFWRRIFDEAHPDLKFVFVSSSSARDAMEDVGVALPAESFQVIHNFIDGDLFRYRHKDVEQRRKILSIRPFTSNVYANDLTVEAILRLSKRDFFDALEFMIVGDGPLFDGTVEPLRRFGNVAIRKGFLTQAQIAELHGEYGVFLVPSRMDSQGVSRDEAMASGLVPVTSRVAAIPEFVDESCGLLAEPEDAHGLADAIERLYRDPGLFSRLSAAAASRVRQQSGYEQTVACEVALFQGAGAGDA